MGHDAAERGLVVARRAPSFRVVAILVALAGMLMALAPQAFARETVQQRIDALLVGSELYMPEGEGPFPVVLQFHGCGGMKNLQARWADTARAAGWAVLVVDSYGHRRIDSFEAYATVCTGLQLWGRERAGDLYAMLEWTRTQGWADPSRIAAAGWSHGGWTVLDAMALQPGAEAEKVTRLSGLRDEPLEGLVGAFILYPWQGFGALAPSRGLRFDAPVQAIVGTGDSVVGGRYVARTLSAMKTPRLPINVEVFDGATHAFDEIEAQDWRVKYSPELTARAHGMYTDFLRGLGKASPRR
jgi:dienelactone hydrolase